MGAPARVVERLRLRAESESALRRALPRLEDAFRTATLPDVGARLVFVRRLTLGRLPADASAQTLSVILESRFAGAGWQPVHASDAQADVIQAVWFRDPLEAHAMAALRVAAGVPVDAWFWPLAVPPLARATTSREALRAIAFSVAARDDAPAALPAWVNALVKAGHEERLVAALHPGDGTALLRAAAIPEIARPAREDEHSGSVTVTDATVASRGAVVASDDRRACIDRLTRRTTARPIKGPTLGSGVEGQGTRSSVVNRVASEAARGAHPTRAIDVPHVPAGAETASPIAPTQSEAPGARVPPHDDRADRISTPDETGARLSHVTAPRIADSGTRDDRAARIGLPASSGLSPGGVPTTAGGLLFLVPVLEHLDFGEWSCQTTSDHVLAPDAPARHLFHVLLSRLPLADDDPSWQLGAHLDEPDDVARAAMSWLVSCRRLLRRRVGLGLASLVLRPARVAITDTHADVFFPLNAADVHIRRAGLDVDPGWVPWFAKVVTFHYGDRPWT
jgi:hypothetical protein